jgi:signal peptidase I
MSEDLTNTGVAEPPARTAEAEPLTEVRAREAGRNGDKPAGKIDPHVYPGPPKSFIREYFESGVVTIIMALFGMTFIVQAVKVPTGSMQNTITIGDHLLVNKFIFAPGPALSFLPQREIRRGDIIVFKYPGDPNNPEGDRRPDNTPYKTNYVKRVIGLPGEHITVRNEHILVNGQELPEYRVRSLDHVDNLRTPDRMENNKPLDVLAEQAPHKGEPYTVYYSEDPEHQTPDMNKEFIVPADSYFVMGDNRNNSQDSRYWGFVPRELVVGRAMFVYWSYDESAPSGNFLIDFFQNTRWKRTGTLIK